MKNRMLKKTSLALILGALFAATTVSAQQGMSGMQDMPPMPCMPDMPC